MERRKFLVGMGSIAAGGAAAMGTGAFTSVEAERSVDIAVAGDAAAFLSIKRATDSNDNLYPNAEEYVEGDASSGTLRIDFTNTDNTQDSDASGINEDAKSIFDNLLDITNNGTQEVELWAEGDIIADNGGSLGVYAENSQGDSSDNGGFSSSDPETLSAGVAATNIGIYVPEGRSNQVSNGTLTFVAEKTGGNQD